jgi:deoxyribodipyrimidine photo-lyase
VVGCGTDAAPYLRVFNPTTQAKKFDPNGDYVREYAPDSAGLEPIVDHAVERQVALDRYNAISNRSG